MTILVTVNIPHALPKVLAFEDANSELMAVIRGAAIRHQLTHRRYTTGDAVLDLTEFASRSDYDAFLAEAGEAIRTCGDRLGGAAVDTIWTPVETDSSRSAGLAPPP